MRYEARLKIARPSLAGSVKRVFVLQTTFYRNRHKMVRLYVAEECQKFAHFTGGVGVVLRAGRFDAVAEDRACLVDAIEPYELLSGHEEGGDIGRVIGHQLAKPGYAFVM